MISTKEIAESLELWAAQVSAVSAYPHEPPSYISAMPIVAARIVSDREAEITAEFPNEDYQQTNIQALSVELAILVNPEPEWTSDQALYDIVDDLKAALKTDPTLGERVDRASREYEVNYDGEVQTADGTRANMARFTIAVANRVGVT